ncbi:hypothetical protein [Enterococcus avium]|uniref:hypothetical protein n=1 Tax=Enterococcus avium TaxID=33945 RepID=UPI00187CAAD0|nr:hypothetical protein [Enterococcus avium]
MNELSITKEFKSLRQLKEFLETLSNETLDKDLCNDGFRDGLSLYEDSDGKTIYYM